MADDTTRINPTIEEDLDDVYKEFVGYTHNDKVKGRLSPSIETAMKAHMAQHFSGRPQDLEEFRERLDGESPELRRQFDSYVQEADAEFGIGGQEYSPFDFDVQQADEDAVFGQVVERCLQNDYSGAWELIDHTYDDSEPEHEALGSVVQALR